MEKEWKKDKIKDGKYLAEDLYVGCISIYDEETNKHIGNYATLLLNTEDDFYKDISVISELGIYSTSNPDPCRFISYMESIKNYVNLLDEKSIDNNNKAADKEYLSFREIYSIFSLGAGDDIIKKGTVKTITNTLKKIK